MSERARRIVITGFMGAGKTTVAAALARLLCCRGADLDEIIEASEARAPQQLIDEEGERRFREAEARALAAALADEGLRVIATGGGAWASESNRSLIEQHGCLTVWLDAPFDLCWERISGDSDKRPLAREEAHARRLYDERLASYRLACMRVSVTRQLSAEEIAEEIAARASRLE